MLFRHGQTSQLALQVRLSMLCLIIFGLKMKYLSLFVFIVIGQIIGLMMVHFFDMDRNFMVIMLISSVISYSVSKKVRRIEKEKRS